MFCPVESAQTVRLLAWGAQSSSEWKMQTSKSFRVDDFIAGWIAGEFLSQCVFSVDLCGVCGGELKMAWVGGEGRLNSAFVWVQ